MKWKAVLSACLLGTLLGGPAGAAAAASPEARPEAAAARRESALEEFLRRAANRPGPDGPDNVTAVIRRHPMRPWPVKTKDAGGTLLFSDSPEYVKEHGILYSDVVEGDVRVFYYHLNETTQPGKLAVVLENERKRRARVRVRRSATGDPDTDYLQVGKGMETDYMTLPQPEQKRAVDGRTTVVLDPMMERVLLEPGELGGGVYDLKLSAPLRVSVVFCPADADPAVFVKSARILPRDKQALRGTFRGMNRTVKARRAYDPDRDGFVYIPIGDDQIDCYREGIDATDETAVENEGNYGILYRFEIPTKGRSPTRLLLSPLGGVYAGTVRLRCGDDEARLVRTPSGALFFGETAPERLPATFDVPMTLAPDFTLSELGLCPPGEKITVEYSPPGASNLPALLILAPPDEETAEQAEARRQKQAEETPS